MLNYIKKMIPYPHTYAANAIYQIADSRKVRECVKYNGELDQFEIPISVLLENGVFFHVRNTKDRIIQGTSIHYYVDLEGNFCFRIE